MCCSTCTTCITTSVLEMCKSEKSWHLWSLFFKENRHYQYCVCKIYSTMILVYLSEYPMQVMQLCIDCLCKYMYIVCHFYYTLLVQFAWLYIITLRSDKRYKIERNFVSLAKPILIFYIFLLPVYGTRNIFKSKPNVNLLEISVP